MMRFVCAADRLWSIVARREARRPPTGDRSEPGYGPRLCLTTDRGFEAGPALFPEVLYGPPTRTHEILHTGAAAAGIARAPKSGVTSSSAPSVGSRSAGVSPHARECHHPLCGHASARHDPAAQEPVLVGHGLARDVGYEWPAEPSSHALPPTGALRQEPADSDAPTPRQGRASDPHT